MIGSKPKFNDDLNFVKTALLKNWFQEYKNYHHFKIFEPKTCPLIS